MRLWRAARDHPWWFCGCKGCRFDLDAPRGTCYLGTDELSGILESIGPELAGGVISDEYLGQRRIFSMVLPSPLRTADLVSRRAAGMRVTNELSTMTPYGTPQAWARAFHDAGFGAIRYRTRFDTGVAARGVACFGDAGQGRRPTGKGTVIDADLRHRLERECKIRVAPPPALSELNIVPDP